MSAPIVLNTRTQHRGTIAEYVEGFRRIWADPHAQNDAFLDGLSENVRLFAPLGIATRGREAGLRSMARTLRALPDLRAVVDAWAYQDEQLYIEMRFFATLGRTSFEWPNVDRFTFHQGVAVERRAYFDPLPLLRVFMSSPAGWRQLGRLLGSA
jgi:hypothetical protein